MILDPQFLPPWLTIFAGLIMAGLLGVAARAAPWRGLLGHNERQHVLLAGLVALLLLWLGTVEITEGVEVHLLAVTCLTMVVGWPLAVLGATVVLIAQFLLLGVPVAGIPVSWLLTIAIPASATRALVHVLRRAGAKNLFLYLLGAGFGGGMVSVLLTTVTALLLFSVIGREEWALRALDSSALLALMVFPEGFLDGMLITAVTVFRPDLVKTFDEDHYLGPR